MEYAAMGTLLVIEDSESVRKGILRSLAPGGDFEKVLEASDGYSGLETLTDEETAVDVVVCGLHMSGMDGFGFLKAARAKPGFMGVPIIMVTSRSDETEMVRAFELGANDFIGRPFSEAILKARLKNMLQIKHLLDRLKAQKEMLELMATTDPLTNIPNLRFFRSNMENEFSRVVRYGHPLSILLVDLDHFKRVNDTFGHPQGDCVLRESARILVGVMRTVDFVARYGGDEFIVIMPHTDHDGAANAADRLRESFEEFHFTGLEGKGALTVSIGVATFRSGMEMDAEGLIDLADKALYKAKTGGRNKVEISIGCVE